MSSISSMSKAKKKSKAPRFSSKMAEPSFEFKGSGYGAEMETPYEPPSKASYPSKSASSAVWFHSIPLAGPPLFVNLQSQPFSAPFHSKMGDSSKLFHVS
eukprot:m.246573 g.246573  ORF g.246573 m.246573 type:complete len:100 (+) comp15381_c0_seq5:107-406(+)